jgi:hypothetical protein
MTYIHRISGKEYRKSYTQFTGHIVFSCKGEDDIVVRNCFGASQNGKASND